MARANSQFESLRTVADYREHAETVISNVEIDEDMPEKSGLYEYTKHAFVSAVWLLRWSRNADTNAETEGTVALVEGEPLSYRVRHPWIHHCCLLRAAIAESCKRHLWPPRDQDESHFYPYYELDWPQSISRITAFNEHGRTALHAMCKFAAEKSDYAHSIFTDVMDIRGTMEDEDLEAILEEAVVEPEVCEQVRGWREKLAATLAALARLLARQSAIWRKTNRLCCAKILPQISPVEPVTPLQ